MQSSRLPHSKRQTTHNDNDVNTINDEEQLDYFVPAPIKLFTLTTKDNINSAIDESY